MNYNFTEFVTVAECDRYLQKLQQNHDDLGIRLNDAQTKVTVSIMMSSMIPSQLETIESALSVKRAQRETVTKARQQREIEIQINTLQNKLLRLLNKQDRMQSKDILKGQYRIVLLESNIATISECKAALELRKAELLGMAA
ncbi:MAG: hypothetical protein IPP69_12955 [Flavobacteriales bacterium]|nr:hypothetical protein [Flavobacteriales bacterium]